VLTCDVIVALAAVKAAAWVFSVPVVDVPLYVMLIDGLPVATTMYQIIIRSVYVCGILENVTAVAAEPEVTLLAILYQPFAGTGFVPLVAHTTLFATDESDAST
jgi:hypothetical protein